MLTLLRVREAPSRAIAYTTRKVGAREGAVKVGEIERSNTMKPSRRYYLHSKVKKAGFKVDGHGRTVYVNFGEEGGGALLNPHILQLQKIGYNIQLRIR